MTERRTKKAFEKINVWTRQRVIILAARLILGGVFVFASIDKILHPAAFAEAVYNYQILPDNLINLTAIVLPWLELVLGSLLISSWLLAIGLYNIRKDTIDTFGWYLIFIFIITLIITLGKSTNIFDWEPFLGIFHNATFIWMGFKIRKKVAKA